MHFSQVPDQPNLSPHSTTPNNSQLILSPQPPIIPSFLPSYTNYPPLQPSLMSFPFKLQANLNQVATPSILQDQAWFLES